MNNINTDIPTKSRKSRKSANEKSKNKKWVKVLVIILGVLLLASGAYAAVMYHSLTSNVDKMHVKVKPKSDLREQKVNLSRKEPFTVLLLGVDQRANDVGRSDTIIVLAVNPNTQSTKMLSIPRDTRVEIVGHNNNGLDKINHAYAFGREEMSMATVEKFLNIPIDYVLKVNMEGFQGLVDAVGGVSVNNPFEFTSRGVTFQKGNIKMNGDVALKYVRMRYEDPNGDFGRQARQRAVLKAVADEAIGMKSVTNFSSIFGSLGKNIKTNMTFDEMTTLIKNYKSSFNKLDQMNIKCTGQYINKISYQLVSDEEKTRVQKELRDQLELNK